MHSEDANRLEVPKSGPNPVSDQKIEGGSGAVTGGGGAGTGGDRGGDVGNRSQSTYGNPNGVTGAKILIPHLLKK